MLQLHLILISSWSKHDDLLGKVAGCSKYLASNVENYIHLLTPTQCMRNEIIVDEEIEIQGYI